MSIYKMDELDQQVIQLLSEDARLSNRKIASQLGFTEGTIRSRVKRLEDENYIRFTACLLYTSPSPRDATLSRMPSSA